MNFRVDLVYAVRGLRKSPGLVAVVTLSLGLGIGVNTTIFNLLNVMVMAPPTAAQPERLVAIEPGNGNLISYLNYRDLGPSPLFAGMALTRDTALTLRRGSVMEQIPALIVSANYFQFLGAGVWLGRPFQPEEAAAERDPRVAIVSYEFWRREFDGDRGATGRTIVLNGQAFTVIGVLGSGFRTGMVALAPKVIVPVGATVSPAMQERGQPAFSLMARLAPGVSRQQAAEVFTAMGARLEAAYPEQNEDLKQPAWAGPAFGIGSLMRRERPGGFFVALATPFVVMGLLLAIACANVAGVMLARGMMRQREVAIRLALGATRGRLVQTLLAESLLLSLAGTAGALLLTAWTSPLLSEIHLPKTPPLPVFHLSMDWRMAAYSLAMAVGTCLICGLVPARQATRPQLLPWLKLNAQQGAGSRGRLRRWLVTVQVMASVLLLMVCVLFLRSLLFVAGVHPGFDVEHGITAQITTERKTAGPGQLYAFTEQLRLRALQIPGVTAASYANLIPLGGDSIAAQAEVKGDATLPQFVSLEDVGPGYFRTMSIPVLRGREFLESDRQGAPPVVVVNQAFVSRYFPHGDALGKLMRLRKGRNDPWSEIVGTVADNKYGVLAEKPVPQVFSPYLQGGGRVFLQVRTAGDPGTALATVRQAIAAVDKTAIADVQTTSEYTSFEFHMRRLCTVLLAGMGALGLLLAMIGLYGVLAWEVSRRSAEIGIRMALGASQGAVRRLVLRDGMVLVGSGIALGLVLAMVVTLPMRSFLAGVSTTDPVSAATVAAVLLAVSAAACWFPVRRAVRVDPMVALRWE